MVKRINILLLSLIFIFALPSCGNRAAQPDAAVSGSAESHPGQAGDYETDTAEIGADSVSENEPPSMALADSEMVLEQIKSGDFSSVTGVDHEALEESTMGLLERLHENRSETMQWVEYDFAREAVSGWAWLGDAVGDGGEARRIEALFAVEDGGARLLLFAGHMQMTSFYFLGKNGNIVYTYSYYGTISNSYYAHLNFDDDLHPFEDTRLAVHRTEDWAIEQAKEEGMYEDFVAQNPYWAQAGVYYILEGEPEVYLEEPEFLERFEAMSGYAFYGDNPVKPDWVNWPD